MLDSRHLISTTQLSRSWIESELFPTCERLRKTNEQSANFRNKALYCLFYEPSFLTRTSFERAIGLLGGQAYHTEDASQFFPVRTSNYIDNVINILTSLRIDLVVVRSGDEGVLEQAQRADTMPVINGGSKDDHPTQALADIYTIQRELSAVDGCNIAIVGRLEHRNVYALLKGLALFDNVTVTLIPFSGQVDPEVTALCEKNGMKFITGEGIEAVKDVDAIYLNGPRTVAHVELLKARDSFNIRIDREFMSRLKSHCVILDPMQRSGDISIETQDDRLAFYRQAENALYVRMVVLSQMLAS